MSTSEGLTQRQIARLTLSFYLPSLLLSFSQGLLIPVLPLYAKSLEASYGMVGLIAGGVGIGMLLGDLPAGLLVRRLGQKWAMLLGAGCTALSTVAMFWAGSVPEAVVYRLFSGFGQALYGIARHAYITEAVRVSSRGQAIALFGGLMRVGHFVGPLLGGAAAKAYGLRAPFLLFGAIYVAAFGVMLAFVERSAGRCLETRRRQPSYSRHLASLLQSQGGLLASAGLGQLFAQMIRAGRGIVIPLYAADAIGLDVQQIGVVVSISSAVDMLFFYPAGLIMDRLGRKWAIVPSFLIQALGMGLVPLTGSYTGILLAASLIGLGNGFGSGSMMTLGADLAPDDARGEFLGIWRLIGDVGSSGGPLAVGAIADWVALPVASLIMAGVGLLASGMFAFLVPETLQKPPQAAPVPSSD